MSSSGESDAERQSYGYSLGQSQYDPDEDIYTSGRELRTTQASYGFEAGWLDAEEAQNEADEDSARWDAFFDSFGSSEETPEVESQTAVESNMDNWLDTERYDSTTPFSTVQAMMTYDMDALADNEIYAMSPDPETSTLYDGNYYDWDDDTGGWVDAKERWMKVDTSAEGFSWDGMKGYTSEGESVADLVAERNEAYGYYLDAAETATNFVNSEISQEQSNANLMGIDYSITDAQKATRVNDYFATIWSESNQTNPEGLMDSYGNPQGFEEFTVSRGDSSSYEGQTNAEQTLATSTGLRPKTSLATEDENILGASTTALGV